MNIVARSGFSLIEVAFAVVVVSVGLLVVMASQSTTFGRATRAYRQSVVRNELMNAYITALGQGVFRAGKEPVTHRELPLESLPGVIHVDTEQQPAQKEVWRSDLQEVTLSYHSDDPAFPEQRMKILVYAPHPTPEKKSS